MTASFKYIIVFVISRTLVSESKGSFCSTLIARLLLCTVLA